MVNTAFNQYVGRGDVVQRQRTGAELNLRFTPENFTRLRTPGNDSAVNALRAQGPLATGTVKRHILQLQAIGLERQRRSLLGKIQRAVLQKNGVYVQRVGDLAAAQSNIDRFGDQRCGLTIPAKGDVFQQNMGRRRKPVIDGIKCQMVAAVLRNPGADVLCAPAGLQ